MSSEAPMPSEGTLEGPSRGEAAGGAAPSRRQRWLLWYAYLGPLLAWAVHIGARYPLVPTVCKQDAAWILHSITGLCLAVTVAAGATALRFLRRTSRARAPSQPLPASRVRYMALGGIAFSVLFGVVIVAELLPALLQDPCVHVRTDPGAS